MANTKLQIIGPTLSAWPGTSRLSHWKKRFLGLFGTTFLDSVSLRSASARLPLWCTSKRSIKGQEVMLAGLPSGRGRARGAQHQVPQTEICSIRPSSPHIPMHWARKKVITPSPLHSGILLPFSPLSLPLPFSTSPSLPSHASLFTGLRCSHHNSCASSSPPHLFPLCCWLNKTTASVQEQQVQAPGTPTSAKREF